ncbi:claudin-like protein ZF-A9 [Clupea harengus]|uniref:Claudin n=1 Tax=Clupea harengus TaxID=7950 RepID=A0A6P8EDX1_CLUHA|nr:claudin-like protein ZF-A9 [Clupea harengus]XP_031414133.1 claudin-like protein ZF-A9 [Clupea harengus]
MSVGLQILGVALGMFGWLGAIVSCVLPLWRVTAFIGNNIVTAQVMWEGLWMNCVVQSTGQMQCKVYDSMLALPQELQASRAILVIAVLLSAVALLASLAGGKCTTCLEEGSGKARVATVAGALLVIGGLLCLIPPSWSAHQVIRDFYNPLVASSQKRELGAALFVCWGSAALLLIGGGLVCASCPLRSGAMGVGGNRYKLTSPTSGQSERLAYV